MKEKWHIELGNDAQLIRTVEFVGTAFAAVRRTMKELRRREPGERYAEIRRPGCRVYRRITQEDA